MVQRSGGTGFALETTQVHLLAVVAGNSAYAFSLMLFAFLIGLGAGSAAGRRCRARAAGPDARLQALSTYDASSAGLRTATIVWTTWTPGI